MAYGDYKYGSVQFSEELSGAEGEAQQSPRLLRHLPEFYARDGLIRMVMDAAAEPTGDVMYGFRELLRQFYVSTATWSLSEWEQELGLTVDPTKPVERRREQVLAKLRGTGTVTRDMIIRTAAAFSGGVVDILEYPAESRFVIKFIGVLGIPANMAGFIQMLQLIKPAHLTFSFEYSYTLWDDVKPLNWASAGTRTWNELRTYEGEGRS